MRTRIDYGIDLGTTNSAIARMHKGEPQLIKSTGLLMDTTPSAVAFNKAGNIVVGVKALNALDADVKKALGQPEKEERNAFIEFKRRMGTDETYYCPNAGRSYTPEELSAEVLKALKAYSDEDILAAAITVPANFGQQQLEATQRAAEMAGFHYCELLQEPIAASLAYGLDADKVDGHWLVFDFGGGTFDAALMNVSEGIMQVVDVEGDNRLGGKDIDFALVDQVILPNMEKKYDLEAVLNVDGNRLLMRERVKRAAEELKVKLSNDDVQQADIYLEDVITDGSGEEVILNLSIPMADFETLVSPIFQRAIDMCLDLLKRNRLTGADLDTVILVGGPTYSHILRRMLKEQISPKCDTSVDPMTCVAKGAALFASTKALPESLQERNLENVQLKLTYPPTTVEKQEKLGLRVLRENPAAGIPDKLAVEISRGDGGWSSGRCHIEDDVCIVPLSLLPGTSNVFTLALFDERGSNLPCEPPTITIMQGLKVAGATLPFKLGLELYDPAKGQAVFCTIPGLDKNGSLPAKGRGSFRTQKRIRPGHAEDRIKCPIYEGSYGADFTRAVYNDHVHDVVITGDDLPLLLPEDSEVEVVLDVNESRIITFSAYFPYIDETVEVEVPVSKRGEVDSEWAMREIDKALQTLALLPDSSGLDMIQRLQDELPVLSEMFEKGDRDTKHQALDRLRYALKKLDALQEAGDLPRLKEQLHEGLSQLKEAQKHYGNEKSAATVRQMEEQVAVAIGDGNIKLMTDLSQEIAGVTFALVSQDLGMWVAIIKGCDDEFDTHSWKDRSRARALINDAKRCIATNPSKERLQGIVGELFALLPAGTDSPLRAGLDDELLKR